MPRRCRISGATAVTSQYPAGETHPRDRNCVIVHSDASGNAPRSPFTPFFPHPSSTRLFSSTHDMGSENPIAPATSSVVIRSVRAKNHKNDQLSRKERTSASQPKIAPFAIKGRGDLPSPVTHLSVRPRRNSSPAHGFAASSRPLMSKQPEQALTQHICLDTRPDPGSL